MIDKSVLFYGVFDETLQEIALGCRKHPSETFYLQPKTSDAIKIIEDESNLPLTLYLTTSEDINTVCYQCEIIKWENKQELDDDDLARISTKMAALQPSETTGVFLSFNGEVLSRHLIHVRNMVKLDTKFSITDLILVSSGKQCKKRSQGGGHAVVYLPEEELLPSVADIAELLSSVASTTTATLINARVGQGKFRKNVIETWGNKETCALTGIGTKALLVASHIKPWALCDSDKERLDGANGILLAAHVDKLFDSYLITFSKKSADYQLLAAKRLEKETLRELNLEKGMTLRSGYLMEKGLKVDEYLEHHNQIFKELDV